MKNRIYGIATGAEWLYWDGAGWSFANRSTLNITSQLLNCRDGEELTDSYREAAKWKNEAQKLLGVPCRVVKIDLLEVE